MIFIKILPLGTPLVETYNYEAYPLAISSAHGNTCNIVIIYSLKAAGDVKFPTMLGIVSEWAIAVTFTYILTQYTSLSIVGAWIAMAIDELFRAVIVFVRWNRKKWQSKGIFNNEENNIAA